MKIPIIVADKPYEVVHTPNVGLGEMAQSEVGAEFAQLSALLAQRQGVLRERERIAQESIKAVEANTEMNNRLSKEKEYFLSNTDYETYDARKQEFLTSLKSEFGPQEGASKEAKIAFARSFNKFSNEFGDFVTTQKYKVMEERGRSAIEDMIVQDGERYATLTSPEDQALQIKSTEMKIRKLVDSWAVDPLWGDEKIRSIEKTFKGIDIDTAKASAINRMSTEPAKLAVDLDDPTYLPAWKDKTERATMKNQAITAAKVQENEREVKRKKLLRKRRKQKRLP